MLGNDGLKKSTALAILNANYIKSRLEKHYTILYSGKNGNTICIEKGKNEDNNHLNCSYYRYLR